MVSARSFLPFYPLSISSSCPSLFYVNGCLFVRVLSHLQANLRGFFCFQVQKHHYVAFVYNKGREEWLLLDDDQAIPVRGENH